MNNIIFSQKIVYSVIVLLEENSGGISEFIKELCDVFSDIGKSFEVLMIANGTEGFLINESGKIQDCKGILKFFALNRKTSQGVCLRAALKESCGEIIVVCGSYKQIKKESFRILIDEIHGNVDVISPWRQHRVDPPINQLQSKVFNMMVRSATGTTLHDLSCTVKVVRREVLEETELYGNMYRFLPILASRKGFVIKEIKCEHHEERGKTGVYKFSEYAERVIDILTLYFNTHFTRKPLRFFGTMGTVFFLTGLFIMLMLMMQRFFGNMLIGDRPVMLLIGILFIMVGVQAAGVGLLGEIIVFTQGRNIKEYSISHYTSMSYSGIERRQSRFHLSKKYYGEEKRKQ